MEERIHQPHDKFYKFALSHHLTVLESIELVLPKELSGKIKQDSIKTEKISMISNELTSSAVDFLFSAEIEGRAGYIYILMEHQSSEEKLLPLRIVKYMIAISEYHLKKPNEHSIPLIYPVIIYNGEMIYSKSTCFFDLFEENKQAAVKTWQEPFALFDLHMVSDKTLLAKPWGGSFQFLLKYAYAENFVEKFEMLLPNLHYLHQHNGEVYIEGVLKYSATRVTKSDYQKIQLLFTSYFQEESQMYSAAEQYFDEGREEGREEGLKEGVALAESKMQYVVNRLLEKGFTLEEICDVTDYSLVKLKALNA